MLRHPSRKKTQPKTGANVEALKMPSGRGAMIERIEAMMAAGEAAPARIVTADEAIAEELRERHGERVLLIEARRGADLRTRVLAVLDLDREALEAEQRRLGARSNGDASVEVIDRATFLVLRWLQASGLLQSGEGPSRVIHRISGACRTRSARTRDASARD